MTFPHIQHIDDVLPALEGRDEFLIGHKEGYTSIDYVYAGPDTFGCLATDPNSTTARIRRECRGIKFDRTTGLIVGRPYHKFFNVGEKAETQPNLIDLTRHHATMTKLDGSMIHPAIVNGGMVFMTRAGVTDHARMALDYATARKPSLLVLAQEMLADGITPIFEWCSPRNRIVIPYSEDRLYLTGARRMVKGEYLSLDELRTVAGNRVDLCPISESATDLAAWVLWVRERKDIEGFIIRFADGHMLKMKADDYVLRHKAKDGLSFEKNVLAVILSGALDDVIGRLSPEDAAALVPYAEAVNRGILATAENLASKVKAAVADVGTDRKRFALEFVPTLPEPLRWSAFRIFGGDEPAETVRTVIKKHIGTFNEVEAVRPLFGGHRWQDFWTGQSLEAA